MPLLLEGEPGTGKTRLAQAIAASLNTTLYEFPVTSESKIDQLIVDFDNIQRLTDAQAAILNAQLKQAGEQQRIDLGGRSVDNLSHYVRLGPLARAYQHPGSVLLIDEIDKGKREFSNSLLYIFSERKIQVPHTGEVIEAAAGQMPTIIITSNREQALPAAFLRRCIYHYINFPSAERLEAIVRLHHPAADKQLMKAAVTIFYQLRALKLEKAPATAEMLDWFAYLAAKNHLPDDLDRLPGSSTLIKSQGDLRRLSEIQQHGVTQLFERRSSGQYN
ncbi:MAG: MoxR family ATPase [Acidobacteria bacterium]|nr:MoxR family ATPase [Acidobacteriota bacterium]